MRGRCDYVDGGLCNRILAIALRRPGIPYTDSWQHEPIRATVTVLMRRLRISAIATISTILLSGCAGFLPTIGPSRSAINEAKPPPNAAAIQIVDIDDVVTRRLLAQRETRLFSETLGNKRIASRTVGPGDTLEVSIWEAVPATLFGTAPTTTVGDTGTTSGIGIATSHATTLPEQPVDDELMMVNSIVPET